MRFPKRLLFVPALMLLVPMRANVAAPWPGCITHCGLVPMQEAAAPLPDVVRSIPSSALSAPDAEPEQPVPSEPEAPTFPEQEGQPALQALAESEPEPEPEPESEPRTLVQTSADVELVPAAQPALQAVLDSEPEPQKVLPALAHVEAEPVAQSASPAPVEAAPAPDAAPVVLASLHPGAAPTRQAPRYFQAYPGPEDGAGLASETPSGRRDGQRELSIAAAVANAVQTHPSVQQAAGFLAQSDDHIDVAKAGYFPQLSGGFNTEYDPDLVRYNSRVVHKMQVSASQMLYDFGKVSSAVGRAEAMRAAARARVLLSIDQVARETAYAVIELQRYERLLKIAQAQVEGVAAIAALARERHQKGAGTLSDELQAQTRTESAHATLMEIQSQVERWKSNVRHLTSLAQITGLTPGVPTGFQSACTGDAPVWGLLPEALAAEAERAAALASLDEASAQILPTLSLEGSAARALNAETRSNRKNDLTAMVNFSMPFYQGGILQAQRSAATHALSAADATLSSVKLAASQRLVEARNQAAGYQQRSGLLSERIKSIAQTRDLYREQYLALGTRTLLDLLNAEQEYHQASIVQANNVHDLRRMQVDCLYSSGRMREAFDLNGQTIAGVEIVS